MSEFDTLLVAREPNLLLLGDCREMLRTLPDCSVHCAVTSPPYFGLRDYGVDGQIGLEPTPDEFVAAMVELFRELRRALRDDGTLWLNLGDSYAGSWGAQSREHAGKPAPNVSALSANQVIAAQRKASGTGSIPPGSGLKAKDLIGIPWRVAFALQADGWYLRQDIIWHKPNPMPESVRDRCTKAHEYIFLLSKRPAYFFDAEAIKEPAVTPAGTKGAKGSASRQAQAGVNARPPEYAIYDGWRNKRDVWLVGTKPFKEAHFATFPPALIEPCILAGTSAVGVCSACGAPHQRVVERKKMVIERSERTHEKGRTRSSGTMVEPPTTTTTGWAPTCGCNAATVPASVLDPFFGAGTTGLVAQQHGRRWIGVELNPDYAEIACRRLDHALPNIGHNGGPPIDEFSELAA